MQQGRCVYRGDIHGTYLPWRSLKPVEWVPWLESEGLTPNDLAYTESFEVVEYEDGSLVAFFTRWELWDASERIEGRSKIKAYPAAEDGRIARTYLTALPVKSIDILLDALTSRSDGVPA